MSEFVRMMICINSAIIPVFLFIAYFISHQELWVFISGILICGNWMIFSITKLQDILR